MPLSRACVGGVFFIPINPLSGDRALSGLNKSLYILVFLT
jgi:hypothetical protein